MKTVKVILDNKSTITQKYELMEEALDFLIKLERDGYKFDPKEVEFLEI